MTVFVFLGPTLPVNDARAELDAIYLPPVSQGDVYRVALRHPIAIGIIDGYFERIPAVWHKEILWAMAQGIHVFGSASMGALRAAELAAFGMEGVGRVFDSYHNGELSDDDEVALAHGPSDSGFRPLSEPMVNIRATLAAAVDAGAISDATKTALERVAKGMFYPDRLYPNIIRRALQEGAASAELDKFCSWLSAGRVDQKRDDAIYMLRIMRQHIEISLTPKQIDYWFEETEAWQQVRQGAGELPPVDDSIADSLPVEHLLDELRVLDAEGYSRLEEAATARTLALDASRQLGFSPDPEARRQAILHLRRMLGLLEPDAVDRWMVGNDLSREQVLRLVDGNVRVGWVKQVFADRVRVAFVDELRRLNQYARLAERARDKSRLLDSQAVWHTTPVDEEAVFTWYFIERHGHTAVPDLAEYADKVGLGSVDALRRLIVREACYVRITGDTAS